MSRKLIALGLIGLAMLIVAHHWLTTGVPFEMKDIENHEFFAGVALAFGLGGLLL